jgi:hypothetical protein
LERKLRERAGGECQLAVICGVNQDPCVCVVQEGSNYCSRETGGDKERRIPESPQRIDIDKII